MIAPTPAIEEQASEILRTLPARISDVVKPWAEISPDSPALVEASGTWTYRQLAFAISETQTVASKSGVRPGDRVMIVGENCREFVALLLAAAGLGRMAGAGECKSFGAARSTRSATIAARAVSLHHQRVVARTSSTPSGMARRSRTFTV